VVFVSADFAMVAPLAALFAAIGGACAGLAPMPSDPSGLPRGEVRRSLARRRPTRRRPERVRRTPRAPPPPFRHRRPRPAHRMPLSPCPCRQPARPWHPPHANGRAAGAAHSRD